MGGFAGFLLSFFIGIFLLWFVRRDKPLSFLDLLMALALGWGLSAQLTFYNILLLNGLNSGVLTLLHAAGLAFLSGSYLRYRRSSLFSPGLVDEVLFFFVIAAPMIALQSVIQYLRPFGDWDAWSLWNFRATALFRSGEDWPSIFHHTVQGFHPWFLPSLINWGWVTHMGETVLVPMVIASVFSLATVGVLVYSLREYVSFFGAFLAGVFLVSIPYFVLHGATQYADVVSGFYILLGFTVALKAAFSKTREPWLDGLAGVFLGLLTFVKNEGIVFTLVFISIMMVCRKLWKPLLSSKIFWISLAVASIPTVIGFVLMKTSIIQSPFIRSTYDDLTPVLFWDMERWGFIFKFFFTEIVRDPSFGWVWIVLLVSFFFRSSEKYADVDRTAAALVVCFLAVFFCLYAMTATNLWWRLTVTLNRLVDQLLPLMVFWIFFRVFRHDDKVC